MSIRKVLVVLLFCFISAYVTAQSKRFSGSVRNNDTDEPVARASISLKGKAISTIANDEGDFDFYVPDLYKADTLHVSAMGYESFAVPLTAIDDNETLHVRLSSFAHRLQEVVFTETLTPEDILRLAIERIPENYYSTPFVQQAFYREVQQADGRYVSLIESALEIYNRNHRLMGQRVKLLQLRRSNDHKHLTNPFWNTYNVLLSSLALNTVGHISKNSLREYTLKRHPDTTLDGKKVLLLSSTTPDLWPIRFYIQSDNYAFVRIEELYNASVDGIKSWRQHNADTIQVFPQNRSVILEYRPSPEKYALNTLSFSISMVYQDTRSNKEILQFGIQQDLLVNDVQSTNGKAISRHEELSRNLENQKLTYDAKFWESYNVIKEMPLHARIRQELERDGTLEQQFRANE